MCYFCVEVSKQNVTPKQFWNLYKEVMISGDSDHINKLLDTVTNTSEEFQTHLVNGLHNENTNAVESTSSSDSGNS